MHEPVLLAEVIERLAPARGGLFVDGTVGAGGHSRALLEAGASRVLGFDRDPEALALAAEVLRPWAAQVELVHADYRDLPHQLDQRGIGVVQAVLADLGVSSMQLDQGERGFSFQVEAPLDMRMDRTQGATAADLLATADEQAIADAIYQYGEERHSRRIARAIVTARANGRIETTTHLAAIVRRAIPTRGWQRIDPATRTFQALRIWVNRELEGLADFLRQAIARLDAGARIAIIAFHSLEDRIVKHTFRQLAGDPEHRLEVITRRPIEASDAERLRNPRARSAKLRVAERLA
jgi:16S rRNA (cytosine1402-N4)-methyltransferase